MNNLKYILLKEYQEYDHLMMGSGEQITGGEYKDMSAKLDQFKLDEKGKFKIYDKCKFSGVGFDVNHEIGECSVAIQVIPLCKNVIEIGGGTGKVSHMINSLLEDKTQHIVVEPGVGGTGNHGDTIIYENKKNFGDKYTIVKKFAENLVYDDIKILKDNPDCLYVDCEGCLFNFQKTEIGKHILKHVRYIINEMDGNNNEIIQQWKDNNFVKIGTGYGCGTWCNTEIWHKSE